MADRTTGFKEISKSKNGLMIKKYRLYQYISLLIRTILTGRKVESSITVKSM